MLESAASSGSRLTPHYHTLSTTPLPSASQDIPLRTATLFRRPNVSISRCSRGRRSNGPRLLFTRPLLDLRVRFALSLPFRPSHHFRPLLVLL
ncbi:MAG: hypothetical protein INR71_10490 [Terriglobus roseus]|nr:hypothetical protein [Terriglobus roseus]